MALQSIKRSDVRTQVGRITGAIVRRSTATGGTTTTIVDTKTVSTDTSYLSDLSFILRPGTSTQEKGVLGAYSTSGDSWTVATLTNTAAAADVYEVWDESIIAIDTVEGLIDQVFGRVFHMGGTRVADTSIVVDDLLSGYGGFEASFTTTPDGWAKGGTGTLSQETSNWNDGTGEYLIKHGRGALKLLNDGSNPLSVIHYFRQPQLLASTSVEFKGWVLNGAASRVSLSLGDGVTADTTGSNHSGTSQWEELTSGSVSFGANIQQAKATLAVATGTQISVYADDLRAVWSERLMRYYLPFAIDRVESIHMENLNGDLTIPIPGGKWHIERGKYPVLVFHDPLDLVKDRHLLIQGTAAPSLWTGDTTAVDLTIEQYTALVSNAIAEALGVIGAETQLELTRLQYWGERANTDLGRADNRAAGSRRVN